MPAALSCTDATALAQAVVAGGGPLLLPARSAAPPDAWPEPAAGEGPDLGPRGQVPVIKVSGKGSGRVSVAGLVCLRPDSRGRLFYRMRMHRGRKGERRSMSEADYAGLIAAAHQQLHAPVILIWDNLNTHVSAAMRAFTDAHQDWLTVVRLPAYAPDLNPAEMGLPQCGFCRASRA